MAAELVLAMLPRKKFPARERGLARTLTITPFFVMPVEVTLFRRSAMFELLGWLTDSVGLPRVNRLGEQSTLSIIKITSWRWTPFAMPAALPRNRIRDAGATPVVRETRSRQTFWAYAGNSIVVAVASTVLVLLPATPTAYALSVRPVRRTLDVLFFFISTKMTPVAAGIIPIYVVAQHPHLRANLPLAVWMIRSFLQEVQGEVLEAAENEYFYAVNLATTTSTLPLLMQEFPSFGEPRTARVAAVAQSSPPE
ncbi:hypothetical protein OG223_44575 [Streptomyces sp. NBC_01478]|uniref:hypothetical protein n=1 Tax=Streptomyces sp. NBC_01478 TaxID=2903882 RepID=UPI002E33C3A1|nr:hypothetical protein [Streptomyces sp. NBC_01478]